jgi:hypothetical protein
LGFEAAFKFSPVRLARLGMPFRDAVKGWPSVEDKFSENVPLPTLGRGFFVE